MDTQTGWISHKLTFVFVYFKIKKVGLTLWSSGQRSRVRFPALPDFLRSSGSGTGSTQPREDN
jgi:hypothetical protein